MEYERKGVNITWQVENVKYFGIIVSPVICLDDMEGTKWILGFRRKSDSTISLVIRRENEDNGPEEFGLQYTFSINELHHKISSSRKKISSFVFHKGINSPEVVITHRKTSSFFDTMTIRCEIWRHLGSISKSQYFFAQTRIKTKSYHLTKTIENFSTFSKNDKRTLMLLGVNGKKSMRVNLTFGTPSLWSRRNIQNLLIEIIPESNKSIQCYGFKFFILDSSGNKTDIGKIEQEITLKASEKHLLPAVSKEYLMENADLYLPNDTLSVQCEITYGSCLEFEKVERTEYKTEFVGEVNKTNLSGAVEFFSSKQGVLCDLKLQTATEAFPVHTTVLCTQSPVFEAMFNTNMKEAIQKSVQIDDVDAETVEHMLVFMYTDTLEELAWKAAIKLYFAADKYQILFLRDTCAKILKENIDLSNCCVLFLLADMHEDEGLRKSIYYYIARNFKNILNCDQWRDLEKNHPQLVIDLFRDHCLKRRSSQ